MIGKQIDIIFGLATNENGHLQVLQTSVCFVISILAKCGVFAVGFTCTVRCKTEKDFE